MKKLFSALVSLAFLAAALASLVLPVKAAEIDTAGGAVAGTETATVTIPSVMYPPYIVGQTVRVNVEISGLAGAPMATGTVTVTDPLTGKSCIASSYTFDDVFQVSKTNCSFTLDAAGTRNLTAVYSGDDYFTAGASAAYSVTVNKATTTIPGFTLEGTPTFGQPLIAHVERRVDPPGGGQPGGPVTIQDKDGQVLCSVTAFDSGLGSCSFTVGFVGPMDLTAVYPGDANYEGSSSVPYSVTSRAATPSITLTPNPASSVVGQDVQMNVTVSGVPGFTPTGRAFVRYDGIMCQPFDLVNGSGSCTVNFASPGQKSLVVTYNGDTYYATTTKTGLSYTVDLASAVPQITSTNPSPSLPGQSFTVNFQVLAQAPGSGTPTGSVAIKDGTVTLCAVDLPAASCIGTISDAGNHVLTAEYGGDSFFNPAQSAAYTHTVGFSDTYADPAGLCGGHTPCFLSIQPAILAAANGRTVTVYPGQYSEAVNVNKAVTVNLNGEVSLNGSLTIAAGMLNSTSGTLSVSGDIFESGGVFHPTGGVLRLDGPISQKLSMGSRINTLRLDKPAPVGYWRFEEGVGTIVADSSPNHLNGSLTGGASFTALPPTLNYANQYALKTDTTYASVAQSEKLGLTDQITLATWAYWNGAGNSTQVLLSNPTIDNGAQQTGLMLGIVNGQPVFTVFDGNSLRQVSAAQSIPVNQWFHIAATYDGRYTRIYLDGQEIATKDEISVKPFIGGTANFIIGREFQTGHPEEAWNGKVDEVQVYARALTSADIALLSRGDEARNSVTLDKPLALDGDLILGSGVLDVSSNNFPIQLRGNWTREAGDFIPRQAAVILDGNDQAIRGANGFYHLQRSTPGQLIFPAGVAQVIAGTLDLHGTAGTPLRLASDTPGTQWQIDPRGSRSLGDIAVSDSANINAAPIDATYNNIANLGNNTGWDFFAPAIAPLNTTATEDQEKMLVLPVSDGDGDSLTVSLTSLPAHGKLYQVNDAVRGAEITAASLPAAVTDPQHRLVYLFINDGPAQVSFDIRASDGLVAASGTVILNLTNVNDLPTLSAVADQVMDENGVLGPINFTVSDEETASSSLLVTVAGSNNTLVPPSGLILAGTGASRSLMITPAAGMDGTAYITLTVQDEGALSVSQTFKLTVNPVNDPPLSADKTVTLAEDTSYPFQVVDFAFTDTHQDTFKGLMVVKTVGTGRLSTENGAVTVGDGTLVPDPSSLVFTPPANANGSPYTSFIFQVEDSHGVFSGSYTLTIDITPVPDAPVAQNDAYTTDEDVPLSVSAAIGVLANDSDADQDPLTAVRYDPPAMGVVTLNSDGSFTYTPNLNANGDDSFTYYASDGVLTSEIVMVSIHINPVDDPPALKIASIPPAKEGSPQTFTATYIDPDTGLDAFQSDDSVIWDFGDSSAPISAGLVISHTFRNNGTFQVQATIKDAQGQSMGADTVSISVANVAPVVSAGGDTRIRLGQTLTRPISFTDPGADTWTATVDYGDGSGAQSLLLSGKSATLQHTYTTKGTWVVTVSVLDSDQGQGSAQFQVVVENMVYVYLPLARH